MIACVKTDREKSTAFIDLSHDFRLQMRVNDAYDLRIATLIKRPIKKPFRRAVVYVRLEANRRADALSSKTMGKSLDEHVVEFME